MIHRLLRSLQAWELSESRIGADYTDDADFGGFVYRRFWSGGRRYGYYGLRTQTGKFAVQTNFSGR